MQGNFPFAQSSHGQMSCACSLAIRGYLSSRTQASLHIGDTLSWPMDSCSDALRCYPKRVKEMLEVHWITVVSMCSARPQTTLCTHGASHWSVLLAASFVRMLCPSVRCVAQTLCDAGHKNAVLEVQWTTDGERVLSASPDKSVRAWDAATGEQVKKMSEHDNFVNSCCPLRRGPPLLVSGSDDATAKVQVTNLFWIASAVQCGIFQT